jgi:hypothetical protein
LGAWLRLIVARQVLISVVGRGAKEILPLAAAGYVGASQAKEMIVTLAHVIPSPAVIVAMGVLLWHIPGVVQKRE